MTHILISSTGSLLFQRLVPCDIQRFEALPCYCRRSAQQMLNCLPVDLLLTVPAVISICQPYYAGVCRHQTMTSEYLNYVPTFSSIKSEQELCVCLVYCFAYDFCSFALRCIIESNFNVPFQVLVPIVVRTIHGFTNV